MTGFKSLVSTALLSMVAILSVFAEQAHAVPGYTPPPQEATLVATRENRGGLMVPPGGSGSQIVSLRSDGIAIETDYYPNPAAPSVTCTLAIIQNPAFLNRLRTALNALDERRLTLQDPGGMECMDAPSQKYKVVRSGRLVEFAAQFGCKDWLPRDQEMLVHAARAREMLDRIALLGGCN